MVDDDRSRTLSSGCQKVEMMFPRNLTENGRKERECLPKHEWQSLGQLGGLRRSSQHYRREEGEDS